MGKFSFGMQNEAVQEQTDVWKENAPMIENSLLQQHKRRLCTWTSPDGKYQNQTNYILCTQRWRSSIQSEKKKTKKNKTGVVCGSDHELLTDNSDLN